MNPLDALLKMTPADRSASLGQPGMRDAIKAFGTDAGIAWLETNIDSPVTRTWGDALASLNPPWHHLDRWIRLSKPHCLAAMDALVVLSRSNDNAPQVPDGASPQAIHDAVDFALAHYGNYRLKLAAEQIRYAWPNGPRKRHTVNVPQPLVEAASIVLGHDADLLHQWQERMAYAKYAAENAQDIWEALIEFAESKTIITIVDWLARPESTVWALRRLRPAQTLNLDWEKFALFDGDIDALLATLNKAIAGQANTLIALDHGGDDYPLTFIPQTSVGPLSASVDSLCDPSIGVVIFPP